MRVWQDFQYPSPLASVCPQDFLLGAPISSLHLLPYSYPCPPPALCWVSVTFKALSQLLLPRIVPPQLPLESSHFSSCSRPPGYSAQEGFLEIQPPPPFIPRPRLQSRPHAHQPQTSRPQQKLRQLRLAVDMEPVRLLPSSCSVPSCPPPGPVLLGPWPPRSVYSSVHPPQRGQRDQSHHVTSLLKTPRSWHPTALTPAPLLPVFPCTSCPDGQGTPWAVHSSTFQMQPRGLTLP